MKLCNYKYPNIDLKRRENNLTKARLSELLGISSKTYLNWQYYGEIPASKLIMLSNLFKCSVDFLLSIQEVGEIA